MSQLIKEKALALAVNNIAQIEIQEMAMEHLTKTLSAHIHVSEGRDALALHDDRIIHFDILKAVTGAASILGNVVKAVTDPTFVSWACVVAALAQIRGITTRISPDAVKICVLLFDRRLRPREELLQEFVADRERALKRKIGEGEFNTSLSELIRLGCLRLTADDWVELMEKVVIRV